MQIPGLTLAAFCVVFLWTSAGCVTESAMRMTVDHGTAVHPHFQAQIQAIDATLRAKYGMTGAQTAVGVLDLRNGKLALVNGDRMEYAASVAKIGILLAYFDINPNAQLDPSTRHELGLMIKASSNEMATRFSKQLGLTRIQDVLIRHQFYDARQGGGLWVGKHYGVSGERITDPVGGFSHGATVRQVLRFYLLLRQGKLVSPEASKTMREIFLSPDIPHDEIKFVKGLSDERMEVMRKWGSWETWLHDSAMIQGQQRHYIMVALTNHRRGDEYLVDFARAVHAVVAAPK